MLLPVNTAKMIFLPISYWVEILKANVEMKLESVYTKIYEPVRLRNIVPLLSAKPESLTDWIFVIYVVGILVFLMRYFLVFICLRWKLRNGNDVSAKVQNQIQILMKRKNVTVFKKNVLI